MTHSSSCSFIDIKACSSKGSIGKGGEGGVRLALIVGQRGHVLPRSLHIGALIYAAQISPTKPLG